LSGDDPLVLGGDLNLRPAHDPEVFAELHERFELGDPTGPEAIDHLLARGLRVVQQPRRLAPAEREVTDLDGRLIRLSDHAPVVAEFVR
jgi:endonuclease/exonuclease/phosphatase (EEP) superfamily protein YafD